MLDPDSSDNEQETEELTHYLSTPTIEVTKHFTAVVEYDTDAVSTLKVFTFYVGTVLTQRILWCQMCFFGAFWLLGFAVTAVMMGFLGFEDFGNQVVHPSLLAVQRTCLIATLLLGFHTTTTYNRWWRFRSDGIGGMWESSSTTTILLSQFTKDEKILESISRYARASLCLLAIARRFRDDVQGHLSWLAEDGILTEEEVERLRGWDDNLAQSIWMWNIEIITTLHHEGVLKSDGVYRMLMTQVLKGRAAAAFVCAQCNTAIPLPYVHVLSLMVKVYSIFCCGVHGASFRAHINTPAYIFEPFLVVFLFNSLLIINNKLCDPFDGDLNDFPIHHYQQGFSADARGFVHATRNLPSWLAARKASKKMA